jgi:glycine/D-amino acid oxidase-like deaminating enzyme
MTERFDVIVVGAGISGAATAHRLRERGARTLLLDRAGPAAGGTGRSAAIVRQHYSTPLMARLARHAVGIFADLKDMLGHDGGYRRVGYLFLAPPEQLDAARANVAMQQQLGIQTEMLTPAALARPWLNLDGVAGAAYEADGGYADPVQTTEAFVAAFQRLGGEARLKCPVRALTRSRDRITGVLTDDGAIVAGSVVNAAGPWAAPLAASAALDLPLRAVREQDTVWEARPDRPIPVHAISNAVDAIYLRPAGDRRFIVGRGFPKTYVDVDPYNYKETADDDFVHDVQGRMEHRFPTLAGARLVHAYGALYDVTPDWYPFVGPRAGLAGYADFNGGSGHGFKVAPAIARELADWLIEGRVADDFRQLSHDRIAAGRPFVQSYGGNRG